MGVESFVATLIGIGLFMAGLLANYYLPGYFAEKGKNLATREDIGEITRRIEEVKAELQARHTLRFAALDKRLQSHQEAFGHCRKLIFALGSREKLQNRLDMMSTWYDENGLYLEANATKAFWDAYYAATSCLEEQDAHPRDSKTAKENRLIILNAPGRILDAIGLPSLSLDTSQTHSPS